MYIPTTRSFNFHDQTYNDEEESSLMIGFVTFPFILARGVRQGDLLGLFLFLIAVKPLVSYINDSPAIHGIESS